MHFSTLEVPSKPVFEGIIQRARPSQPGRDTIPYTAYKALPDLSADILQEATVFFAEQAVPEGEGYLHDCLTEFNEQNVCFSPKGAEEEDKVAPTRNSDKLRTIFLSNTDCKLIAASVNSVIIIPCIKLTPQCQRGFVPGRQFCLNVVV